VVGAGTFLPLWFATNAGRDAAAGKRLALLTAYSKSIRSARPISESHILSIEIGNTYMRRPAAHLDMDSALIEEWARRYWEAARAQ
jgi:hypothetical protein